MKKAPSADTRKAPHPEGNYYSAGKQHTKVVSHSDIPARNLVRAAPYSDSHPQQEASPPIAAKHHDQLCSDICTNQKVP